ncbi:MAG: hypothetical protein AMXMBFR82_04640 [Candidatus Hydrogenedentota bacterium]
MGKQNTADSRRLKATEVPADQDETPVSNPVVATNLDRVIHERMRLAVVSALAVNPSLSFNELKRVLKTTDGNLSVHARKLEDAGYIHCDKFFQGRTPRTVYRLTQEGRDALERYLNHMEALIRKVREDEAGSSP